VTIPIAPGRAHTDAFAALLAAANLPVGRGTQPPGSGWQGEEGVSEFVPYVVLFPSPGQPYGNEAEPYEYLDYTVQATVVAATQEGAEAAMDRAKTALVGARPAVAGRSAYRIQPLLDLPARRDDTLAPPLHYAVAQFRVRTQPS
jgi:hypothetical protein